MRPTDTLRGADEVLQADVMRFMAMISMCLIAILGLVRSAEPRPETAAVPAQPQAVPVPAARPSVVLTPVSVPASVPSPASVPVPSPAPSRVPAAPVSPPDPLPAPTAEPAAAPSPAPKRGLRLRFASDQDFLRLLNQGVIRVFAFRDGEVLLVGSDFRLHQTPAPGELHELLPETIPDLLRAALGGAENGDTFRWGVAMSERMSRQIESYLDRGVSGELIIDRFGEVRHHDA